VLASRSITREEAACLERIEAMVRARFRIGESACVLVSEEDGRLPGAPPRSTRVLFWTVSVQRHRITVFKRLADVTQDDLRSALLDDTDCDRR
jgi:hypothetical protein